jgi:hypothetical protein
VGTLDKVLDMADENDWIIVDTKRDWQVIFPFEKMKIVPRLSRPSESIPLKMVYMVSRSFSDS